MSEPRAESVRELLRLYYDRNDEWAVTKKHVRDLLDAYDERMRVNVGLVAENAALRQQLRERTPDDPLAERKAALIAHIEEFWSGR